MHRADARCVYTLSGSDGRVQIAQYAVFPGIWLLYRDVHAGIHIPVAASTAGLLEIDHCREGRLEFQYGQAHFFLAPGDLAVLRCDAARSAVSFPTGHYHGISVIDASPACAAVFVPHFAGCERAPGGAGGKILRGDGVFCCAVVGRRVEHIFSELYSVPEDIRRGISR